MKCKLCTCHWAMCVLWSLKFVPRLVDWNYFYLEPLAGTEKCVQNFSLVIGDGSIYSIKLQSTGLGVERLTLVLLCLAMQLPCIGFPVLPVSFSHQSVVGREKRQWAALCLPPQQSSNSQIENQSNHILILSFLIVLTQYSLPFCFNTNIYNICFKFSLSHITVILRQLSKMLFLALLILIFIPSPLI